MSKWVGGLPPELEAKADKKKPKKSSKPASPPDGEHPKTFYGGAIPPVPPKMPKYKKEEPRPVVKITGAGPPIREEPKMEPKDPQSSPSATPPPSPPSPPPPPPPSPASYTTPQSSPPDISPKRLPSVFDKKPKMKKEKKKKKKPPPPPPQPKPIERDPEECGDDVCGDGDGDLGQLPSIFAICYIPKTRQGDKYDDDERGYKEDRSGQASPRSDEEDDDPDIPAAVPSYMCPDEFASIFGKKIDARNLAEVGPHGWHPTANAPYDITDTGDTVTVGPSGWHEPRSE